MQDTTSTPDIITIKDNQAQSPQLGSEYKSRLSKLIQLIII